MVKNKKALSAMIGYILLVSFGIVMAVIVFTYLKTYIPKDLMSCPDGTSMFLRDYSYDCTVGQEQLNITLKNNGKFNVAGFFVLGANDSESTIATYDLSNMLDNTTNRLYANAIVVNLGQENLIIPGDESQYIFNLEVLDMKVLEILPMRFQEDNGKIRPVSCTAAKLREELICTYGP